MITRGAAGLTLLVRGGKIAHVPARPREMFDVSGAGDTVVAALALALAVGSDSGARHARQYCRRDRRDQSGHRCCHRGRVGPNFKPGN